MYGRGFPPAAGGKELLYISGRAQLMSVDARAATTRLGERHVSSTLSRHGGGATINNWYWDVAAGGERMHFNAGSTETGASLVTVVVNWRPGLRAQADTR